MADPLQGGIPPVVDDGDVTPITQEDHDRMDAEWDAHFQEWVRAELDDQFQEYLRRVFP